MAMSWSAQDLAFRDELSRWLDQNIRYASDPQVWHQKLVEGRWVVPSWPERYGGRRCTVIQEIIYNQEMGARDAPVPRNAIGLFNIGPMLLAAGTEAQRDRFLPKMVSAEEIWCQGFSEPNAGSDLAALEMRAEDRGDHWLVSGQKTWNTYANEADLCLALVRTDPRLPKHEGISALIIDMHATGVEVRPLREITGEEGFNEIFFTEVRVPKQDIVGPINGGWKIAMSTLAAERLGTMKIGVQLDRRLQGLVDLARSLGRDRDPVTRQAVASLAIQVELMQLLTKRALSAVSKGEDPGVCLPLGKLQWSYLMQDLAEQALAMGGSASLFKSKTKHALPGEWAYHAVYSRMTTIGAGTTEVQKNIIAARELGLPRDAGAPSRPARARDQRLAETDAQLRDSARRFLRERAPIKWVRRMLDDPRGTTDEVWGELSSLGLCGILAPEALGGLGLGLQEMGLVIEEMGRAVHPGPFASTALAATAALILIASEEEQRALLPAIADGAKIATLALIDLERAPATVDREGLISGEIIAPDGAAAHTMLVIAERQGELGLYAIESARAQITPLATVDQTRKLAEVVLDRAPAQRLGLGEAREKLTAVADRVTLGQVIDALGAADRALELATEYAKVRRQFDRPIGSFQAIQHKLADMLRSVELARSGAYEALQLADAGDERAFHRAATVAKGFAADALFRVVAEAIQVFGGIGFTWEHDAHLYLKRVMSMQHAMGGAQRSKEEYARLIFGE
jgi:acyl-CoA dehydrogenase